MRAVTLLPEPDSPTMARQRPGRVVNEMPLTTSAFPNDTRRFSTVSSGELAAALTRATSCRWLRLQSSGRSFQSVLQRPAQEVIEIATRMMTTPGMISSHHAVVR